MPSWESLSLAEQVAQLFVVRASAHLFDHEIKYPQWEPPSATLKHWVEDLGVGGVILLGGSAAEVALRSQQLQSWAKTPLFIAADIEEGVGQRFSGATWFPPPMALSAIAAINPNTAQYYAEQMGAITAKEALAIGINWVLAPVVDVNNNPLNPVINVRAFGETPTAVSQLTNAFIRGTQHYPVLTCAKHFPGHGNTDVDSHLHLPVLPHSPAQLAEIELPPFKEAIAVGVDSVMAAHLLIPAWDTAHPATLSQQILTELLREDLGFEGLIVTDALVMGAIANNYGANIAPVLALEAGADILLMPVDPAGAIVAVCEAVESGRIPRERIHASLKRIWQAKHKICTALHSEDFHQSKQQKLETRNLVSLLAQPDALNTAANILRNSQQVYGSVPLSVDAASNISNLRNLIVVDDALNCDFLAPHTPAIALPQKLGYQLQVIDRHSHSTVTDSQLEFSPTLLQLFIRGNPFRGSAGLTPIAESLFKQLLKNHTLQAVVIYGSPYVLQQFLPYLPQQIPCIFSYGQMPSAQAIALQVLFG